MPFWNTSNIALYATQMGPQTAETMEQNLRDKMVALMAWAKCRTARRTNNRASAADAGAVSNLCLPDRCDFGGLATMPFGTYIGFSSSTPGVAHLGHRGTARFTR